MDEDKIKDELMEILSKSDFDASSQEDFQFVEGIIKKTDSAPILRLSVQSIVKVIISIIIFKLY
jgi:hypothetical protein